MKKSLFTLFVLMTLTGVSFAATRTWDDGSSNHLWSTAQNWSGDTVPVPYDVVIFDGTCTNNCSANIVSNNMASITLASTYTGTVTFATNAVAGGMSLTVTGDITVASGNLVFTGNTTTDSIPATVENDGMGYTLQADNITIASNASMNADGKGFGEQGPGGGTSRYVGGTYGGIGCGNSDSTYGSVTNPTSLGSGTVHYQTVKGGGAIILNVTSSLTVNGTLSANGLGISDNGSGSGGSINIACGTLSGSGTISAEGGAQRAGGGGGRISLVNVTTNSFSGTLSVKGGYTSYFYGGRPGTIAFPSNYTLTLGGTGNMSSLRLGTDSTPYNYSFNSITINNGGTLEIDGNPKLNIVDGTTQGTSATITATNITINTGGTLTANGLGFGIATGPGAGGGDWGGGTYGGTGINNPTSTYGSVTNPTSLGSGSGGGYEGGGDGGGAIILNVTNTLIVNGTLSANGIEGLSGRGGGSGGSINITTGTLAGSGDIRAQGGGGASGGGGRIKIAYTTKDATNPIDSNKVYAYAGGSTASAGTIYLKSSAQTNGDLLVDDNNYGALTIPIPTNNFIGTPPTLTFDSVTVTNSAKLVLPTNMTLAVNGDFSNISGSFTAYTNSSVALASTNQAIVSGSTTFYNLTSMTQGKVIKFKANSTNTVAGKLTLTGVTLHSTVTGDWWYLNLVNAGEAYQDVSGVTVRDSNATNGQTIIAYPFSKDEGHNVNWTFLQPAGTVFGIQ